MKDHSWPTALGGMAALAAGMGIGRFVYTPILPVMAEGQHLTGSEAGLIASANFLGYLAGALLAAAPVFRTSPRLYLMGALTANAVLLAAMGVTNSFAAYLVFRFLGGWASAFVLVFASSLVLDRLAANGRAGLSAVHFAGVGVGIAVSAMAVAGFGFAGIGWQGLWLASGFLALIGLVVAGWLLPATLSPQMSAGAGKGAPAPIALKTMISAYGLFGFGYVITATFIVAMVRGTPDTKAMEAYVWVLFGLTAVPSVALWTWIGARFGVLPAFAAACLVEAAGVVASVAWLTAPGILIAVICLGGTFMGLTALGLIAARRLSTGDPRPNVALMTAAFGAGQVAGPAFAGLLFDRLGSFFVPSLAAAAALILAAGLAAFAATVPSSSQPKARASGHVG